MAKVYLSVSNPQEPQEVPLDTGGYWTIGRGPGNTIVFNDTAMSRRHAVIQEMQPGKFYFIDLGSRNGSMLNGRRVTIPSELHDSDAIVCGQTQMVFHHPEAEPTLIKAKTQISTATEVVYARCLITVLVVDIRDFTPLTRQLDESILAQVIGTWFREAGIIVRRNGCTGDKYIGDAVMAVWTHSAGGPKAAEIHGILQALSEIQILTSNLHQQFPLPAPIRIGAGINTGLSMMGNTGGQDSPDFSPLGDNVNAAFRLETATKKSGLDIALGRMTFECLGKDPEAQQCFEKRAVELKGYEQAVEAWLTSFTKLDEFLRSRVQG